MSGDDPVLAAKRAAALFRAGDTSVEPELVRIARASESVEATGEVLEALEPHVQRHRELFASCLLNPGWGCECDACAYPPYVAARALARLDHPEARTALFRAALMYGANHIAARALL